MQKYCQTYGIPTEKKNYFIRSAMIASSMLSIIFMYPEAGSKVLAKEPEWVLKEKPTEKFLCSEGVYCVNPQANIIAGSARMSFGVAGGECSPVYEVNAVWPDFPETIKPGSSQSIPLSVDVRQNVSCPGAIAEKADVSVQIGKAVPPETPGNFNYAGSAEIASFPVMGATKKAENSANWTAPEGEIGEFLYVKVAASLKNGLGGYINYVYEYQDGSVGKTDTAFVPESNTQDVCAIGLKKSSYILPRIVKSTYARDSGARFADFSGEVTVAPGSDPKNAEPAEMDMVIDTGSIIKTEAESIAIISFADMTTFCMKPFTTVIIDTPPEKESKMSLLAGKIWMNVKKMLQEGTMNVTLNQAVAGIKGTVLVLEDNGQESILKVVEGTVEYEAKKDGAKTTVTQGEMARAGTNGLIPKENFDIQTERNNWQEFTGSLKKSGFPVSAIVGFITASLVCIGTGAWIIKRNKGLLHNKYHE
jgi:hypothetical protein